MPLDLLWFPGTHTLIYLAGLGAIIGLLRRRAAPLMILLWVALVYGLVNLPLGSDRGSWFLTNSSLAIALYFPVAILAAELAGAVWGYRSRLSPALARWAGVAITAVALSAGLYGAWRFLPVVNPQTILVTRDDLTAMQWVKEHTPREARFLVNAVPWQVGVYRGTDGGWWIPLLTGRSCTLPPVLYKSATPQFRAQVDRVAEAVARGELPGGENWREQLRALNVSYIYIGAQGGPLRPEKLRAIPGLKVAFVHGPVWIFQVE